MVELFNPYEYAFHEDPYPTYARLRAEAPVYRNEQFDLIVIIHQQHHFSLSHPSLNLKVLKHLKHVCLKNYLTSQLMIFNS